MAFDEKALAIQTSSLNLAIGLVDEPVQTALLQGTIASAAKAVRDVLSELPSLEGQENAARTAIKSKLDEIEGKARQVSTALSEAVRSDVVQAARKVAEIGGQATRGEMLSSVTSTLLTDTAIELGVDRIVAQDLASGHIQAVVDGYSAAAGAVFADHSNRVNEDLRWLSENAANFISPERVQSLITSVISGEKLQEAQAFISKFGEQDPMFKKVFEDLGKGTLSMKDAGEFGKHLLTQVGVGIASDVLGEAAVAVELASSINNLKDLPTGTLKDDASSKAIMAYAGVAKAASQLVGRTNPQLAKDINKAVEFAQTGYQVYQAAMLLKTATGWGAAMTAFSLVSGIGGMSSLGLGGSQQDGGQVAATQAILGAIARLQAFIEAQFAAVNQRLDLIEDTLRDIQRSLRVIESRLGDVQLSVDRLQVSVDRLQTQINRAVFDITEDDRLLQARQLRALTQARVRLPVSEVVMSLEFNANRIAEAMRSSRVMSGEDLDRCWLSVDDYLKQSQSLFDAPNTSADKSITPIGALLSLLTDYERKYATEMGKEVAEVPTPIQIPIALTAIRDYIDTVNVQIGIRALPEGSQPFEREMASQATRITDLVQAQLAEMRHGQRRVQQLSDYLRPRNDRQAAWVVERLLELLKVQHMKLHQRWERFEWTVLRDFLYDVNGYKHSDNKDPDKDFVSRWTKAIPIRRVDLIRFKNRNAPKNYEYNLKIGPNDSFSPQGLFKNYMGNDVGYTPDFVASIGISSRVEGVNYNQLGGGTGMLGAQYDMIGDVYGYAYKDFTRSTGIIYLRYATNMPDDNTQTMWSRIDLDNPIIGSTPFQDVCTKFNWAELTDPNALQDIKEEIRKKIGALVSGLSGDKAAEEGTSQLINYPTIGSTLMDVDTNALRSIEPYLKRIFDQQWRNLLIQQALVNTDKMFQFQCEKLQTDAGACEKTLTLIRACCAMGMPEAYQQNDAFATLIDGPRLTGNEMLDQRVKYQMQSPAKAILQALKTPGHWTSFMEPFLAFNAANDLPTGNPIRKVEFNTAHDIERWIAGFHSDLEQCISHMRRATESIGRPLPIAIAARQIDAVEAFAKRLEEVPQKDVAHFRNFQRSVLPADTLDKLLNGASVPRIG